MWSTLFLSLFLVLSANAFSKYGRSCKDIGCLNSEVCVLAEEPCSYGRTSDCGTYPTCKKKTAADGGGETHNVPVTKHTTPKPIAELRPQHPPTRYNDDDAPNYPAPAPPPRNPYGTNSGGGSSYGTNGGGGNPYGTNSGGSGSNGNGFTNPFAGFNFGNAFGTNGGGGSSGGAGGGGSNPISSILTNFLSNFTKGLPSLNPSFTRPGLIENRNTNPNPSNPYGNPSNPYGNQPNPYPNQPNPYYPNYPAYPSNGQNNPNQRQGYYPSYNQPSNAQASQPTQQNGYIAKNYGQSHASRSHATTRRPVSYGWSLG